jgi:hypothetical protein
MARGQKRPLIKNLALKEIERSGGTQTREATNEDVIDDYAEKLRVGVDLGAPVVFFDGKTYWLADGFHRVAAHERIKAAKVACEVRPGDRRAALLYACGANAAHGLRRSNADKRRSVTLLLSDPEWTAWSDNAVAKHCGVGRDLVTSVRRELVSGGRIGHVTERKGADGKVYDTSVVAAANHDRAVAKKASATAGTLTPESAPTHRERPRVVHEHDHAIPEDPEPTFDVTDADDGSGAEPAFEEPRPDGGEVVEDGAMADTEDEGLVDVEGTAIPAALVDTWTILETHATAALEALKKAGASISGLQDLIVERIRATGSQRGWPVDRVNAVEQAFDQGGRVATLVTEIRKLMPYAVCTDCGGKGCHRCSDRGWFSRLDFKERERVDGILDRAGVTVHRP